MRLATVMMTPNDAEKLLLASAGQRQRPLDQARVKLYARKMKDGLWRVTHQPIAIDSGGVLFDGQHRVAAVALAGINVEMSVVYDAEPETFDTIDVGKSRTPGQTLAIAGYGNGNVLAAAARYLLIYKTLQGTAQAPTALIRNAWTSADIVRFIEDGGGDWLLGSMTDAQRLATSVGRQGIKTWMTSSIALLNSSGADATLRLEFLEKLENGTMLSPGSPILSYRRWLSSDTGYIRHPGNVRGFAGMANFVKAWNAWVNREDIHVTVFKPGTEILPALVTRPESIALDIPA